MRIVDLIRPEMVIPSLSATNKIGVIRELAHHLATHTFNIGEDELVKVLVDREGLASTAIGEGVAIPHGKLPSIKGIVACIGRARNGIDFDSMDGQPTFLFFVMVAPEHSAGAHLKALARISRVFKDRDFRHRLLDAPDVDSIYEVITLEDAKY